ncbi:MAG: VTT domain-containing protein [Pseudomonadota bacterium]
MLRYGRLLIFAAFLAVLFLIVQFSGIKENFEIGFLRRQFEENALLGMLLFTLLFVLGNLARIPGLIFLGAALLALGQVLGGVAAYVAAVTSCVVTFFVIRFLGGDALRKLRWPWAVRLLERLDRRPVASIILLRIFMMVAPPLNYALAMSGVKFRHYLIGTVLGIPLPLTLLCIAFEYIAKAFNLPVT